MDAEAGKPLPSFWGSAQNPNLNLIVTNLTANGRFLPE
jgi:hypothetical protein